MSGFDINQLTITGRLTRSPELRNLPSGTSVCSLRIAHNERYKDAAGEWNDRGHFFNVTVWGGLGEWIAANVNEGDKVAVAGRLRWHEWQTDDGDKRQAVEITADSILPIPRATSTKGPRDEDYAAVAAAADDDIPF